jgi:hypothetical protein
MEEGIAMSFDLMLFDKAKAPNFFEDFLAWYAVQTEWSEDRDYNSTDGTSPQLAAWFMAMKETFPPMNGPYSPSDATAFATAEAGTHLTDYSIGSSVIYGDFAWSVAEEAAQAAEKLAKEHGVGLFNPQTGDIFCDGMVVCKIRTERHDDKTATWERVEKEVLTIDNPERGTTHRDSAFITMFFAQNGTDEQFLQCMPDYPKQRGFLKNLVRKKAEDLAITAYIVEVGTGKKIYTKTVGSKEQVSQFMHDYYVSRKLPDITGWQDTGII